jgi:tripartite-type tricarboxylate transporter receptor subunit TctC
MLDTTACLPFVAAGRMKALAVASKARNPALPNVPTFEELGIANVYSSAWYGLMAPAGTPASVVARVNAEMNALLKTPEVRRKIAEFGGESGGGTPAEFERFVAAELQRYAAVVKASGARIE